MFCIGKIAYFACAKLVILLLGAAKLHHSYSRGREFETLNPARMAAPTASVRRTQDKNRLDPARSVAIS